MRWESGLPFDWPVGGCSPFLPPQSYVWPQVTDPPWMYLVQWSTGVYVVTPRLFQWEPTLGPWGTLELYVGPD